MRRYHVLINEDSIRLSKINTNRHFIANPSILSSLGAFCYSPNRFICRGSDGLGNTCLGPEVAKFLKTADNFCAQARYFVHVNFASLRRFCSVASLLQKNTYEFIRVSSKSWSKTRLSQGVSPGPPESYLGSRAGVILKDLNIYQ